MSAQLLVLAQRLCPRLVTPSRPAAQQVGGRWARSFGGGAQRSVDEEVEAINEAFVAARDELEYAEEDAETTRFDESFEEAKRAVSEAVGMFDALLSRLPGDEAGRLQRSMGLKMQQLKAELSRLETLHAEH